MHRLAVCNSEQTGHIPGCGGANDGACGNEGGGWRGVPRSSSGTPAVGSIERGLRELGDGRGASVRKLADAHSPGLRAIIDAVRPELEANWSIEDKAAAALDVILQTLATFRNENWKAVTEAAYGQPEEQYRGPQFDTRAARWRERAQRDEDLQDGPAMKSRLETYRGFFVNAVSRLSEDVEQMFQALNREPSAWERYRRHEPSSPTHLPVTFERVDVLFRLQGNVGVQQLTYRWLKALEPISEIEVVGWYYSQADADLDIVPLANCTLDGELDDLPRGGRIGALKFARTLNPGDDYFFAYSINYRSEKPCRPVVSHEVRGRATKLLTVRVQFDPQAMPDRCWCFEAIGELDGQRVPSLGSDRDLVVSANGYVDHEFKDAVFGRKYGIMWRWEPNG